MNIYSFENDGETALISVNNELVIMDKRLLPEGADVGDQVEVVVWQDDSPLMEPGTYVSVLIIRHNDEATIGEAFGRKFQIDKRLLPTGVTEPCILHIYINYSKAIELYKALADMSRLQRNTFVMVEFFGYTIEDLAVTYAIPEFMISYAYGRCINHLRSKGFDTNSDDFGQYKKTACKIVIVHTSKEALAKFPILNIFL